MTNEYPAATGCITRAGRVNRTRDYDALHSPRDDKYGVGPEVRKRIVHAGRPQTVDERDADGVRSGLDGQPEAAWVAGSDLLAVDRDVESGAASTTRTHAAAHSELVLGVQGKRVLEKKTAPGAERQAFDVAILREAAGSRVSDLGGDERAVADGSTADFHRRGHIALNERRRHAQRVGDVVEPFARIIGRQQCLDVNVQGE